MRSLIFSACFVIVSILAVGQTPSTATVELERLMKESVSRQQQQAKRAKEYAEKNNVPLSFKDSKGNLVLLVDVDEFGLPLYKSTDNAGAAITTGASALGVGGALGLNLEGEGMFVGIWDGGSVSHQEYADRILGTQGNEDDHATHVVGTIIASGLNSSAKGMAPKAKAYTFDFANDESEMLTLVQPDQTSLLLSNHSYGLISGWNFNGSQWQWYGNPAISADEDYKFGYYSSNAAFWDQIAYNAPFYSIVKSAGNDRNNTGNGTRPPDCNGGAGYDCISDVSTAKNIITVGAVNKVFSYTGPTSVGMSSFSSWGPTDDGRIKPDIVAAGVGLFSSITGGNYGSLSGTSMSSPNATGSLLLLQELHKNLHGGEFMRAATLKALAIHSAKETGAHNGPDYKFGWGLLDVQAGAKVLLNEDESNVYVIEQTLTQGQTFELALTPKANEKIKVTLVWTDPPGAPVATSLDPTNIMLVNDLDLRISDDADNIRFPWILNPADPDAAATTGDNIRDNVEKLEFDLPEPRNYTLAISHKGSLFGGSQNFSLIVEYTSINDPRTVYYWIGGSGSWDNPSNWSLSSGGTSANTIPGANDRVFIDENSFSAPDQVIEVSDDVSCGSLTWLANQPASLSLNNNILQLNGNLIITSNSVNFSTPGTIRFNDSGSVNIGENDLSPIGFEFEKPNGSWTILSTGKIGGITLNEGILIGKNLDFELNKLFSVGSLTRSIDLTNTKITGLVESNLYGSNLSLLSKDAVMNLSPDAPSIIHWDGMYYEGQLVTNGEALQIAGESRYSNIHISGDVEFSSNNVIDQLTIEVGSLVKINSGSKLELSDLVVLESDPDNKTEISSTGAGSSELFFNGYFKLCFDNLIIDGIDIAGTAIINAGENSELTNSNGWVIENCDNILFPKFTTINSCVGSLVPFTDETSGIVDSWNWNFGNPTSDKNTSTNQSPYHVYDAVGDYEVTLTVSNSNTTRDFSRIISIKENMLLENHVLINFDNLFSFRASSTYQWYKDDQPIAGATARTYKFDNAPGTYFVLTIEDDCNMKSDDLVVSPVITNIPEPRLESEVFIFPNPVNGSYITITVPEELLSSSAALLNSLGTPVRRMVINENTNYFSIDGLPSGLYFIKIEGASKSIIKRLVVSK
jgi:hypothetical protein